MARLAFYTFGLLKHPYDHPVSQEFIQTAGQLFALLPTLPGFVTMHLRDADTPHPSFVDQTIHYPAATLTVWDDIESAWNFAYKGPHFESMKRREDWVINAGNPAYIMWWISDDEDTSYLDAVRRFEYYTEHGPSPTAFMFKNALDANGNPVKLNFQKQS